MALNERNETSSTSSKPLGTPAPPGIPDRPSSTRGASLSAAYKSKTLEYLDLHADTALTKLPILLASGAFLEFINLEWQKLWSGYYGSDEIRNNGNEE